MHENDRAEADEFDDLGEPVPEWPEYSISEARVAEIIATIPNERDRAALTQYRREMGECLESSDTLLHDARGYCDQAYIEGWCDGRQSYREAITKVLGDPPPMQAPKRPPWRSMTKEQMRKELFDVNAR